jgi:hypothetical protein
MRERGEPVKRLRALAAAHQPNRKTPISIMNSLSLLRLGLLLLLTGLLLAGCASVPKDYPRTESAAFEDHQSTAIGRYVAKAAARHPGESGFAIIRYGRQAFTPGPPSPSSPRRRWTCGITSGSRMPPAGCWPSVCFAPPTAACGCACCSTT